MSFLCKTCRSTRQLVFVFLRVKFVNVKKKNGRVTHVNILVNISFDACRAPDGKLSIC